MGDPSAEAQLQMVCCTHSCDSLAAAHLAYGQGSGSPMLHCPHLQSLRVYVGSSQLEAFLQAHGMSCRGAGVYWPGGGGVVGGGGPNHHHLAEKAAAAATGVLSISSKYAVKRTNGRRPGDGRVQQ